MLSGLLPPGEESINRYVANRLRAGGGAEGDETLCTPFPAEWIAATQPIHSLTHRPHHNADVNSTASSRQCSEATLNKLCAALENTNLSFVSFLQPDGEGKHAVHSSPTGEGGL